MFTSFSIDTQALIAFGLAMICALLVSIAFFKGSGGKEQYGNETLRHRPS